VGRIHKFLGGFPSSKTERQVCSDMKSALSLSPHPPNIHGVIHYEFLPEGQTVNQNYYTNILRHMQE